MRVKLGRTVSGEQLIEAIKRTLPELPDCEFGIGEVPRYEPGSSKIVMDSCEITVWQIHDVQTGLFKKRVVRERTGFYFDIPQINTDKCYADFAILMGLKNSWSGPLDFHARWFVQIESLLDAFCKGVQEKISALPAG